MNSIPAINSQLLSEPVQKPTRSLSPKFPLHADCSAQKKRLFVRKPCGNPPFILADKKRKQSFRDRPVDEVINETFCINRENEPSIEISVASIQDSSLICEDNGKQSSVAWTKEMFFRPCPSQSQLCSGLKYIQRDSFKLSHQELKRDILKENESSEMDATTDRSTESFLHISKSSNAIKIRPSNIPINNQQNDKVSCILKDSKPTFQEKWCVNCSNNRQKCHILTERCFKLQEQIQLKDKTIRDLSERIEQFNFQRVQSQNQMKKLTDNELKMHQILDVLERRAAQSEYDLSLTFQTAKKEVQRLNERLKYMEMENTMLLRYKEEYGMVNKECDKLRYDNDHLKRQLNNIARMDSNFNFKKQNKVQIKAPVMTDRHKVSKGISSLSNKDQDAISLDLSEWSVEQF